MKTVFDNGMTGHVWAQGKQAEGRSQNGNLFFSGRALYSYGRHYVAGFLLPDGTGRALLNATRYSVSTSRHVSEAARAVRGRSEYLENLTEWTRLMERAETIQTYARTPEETASALAEVWNAARVMAEGTGPDRAKASRRGGYCEGKAEELAPLNPAALAWVLGVLAPGMAEERARAHADKFLSKRLANREAWKQAGRAEKLSADLATARAWAERPLSLTVSDLAAVPRAPYFSAERAASEWSEQGKGIFRGAKAARSKGWTRVAEKARAHYDLIRAALPLWPEAESLIRARARVRERVAEYRAAVRAEAEILAADCAAALGGQKRPEIDPRGPLGRALEPGVKAARFLASALNPDHAAGFESFSADMAGRVMRAAGFRWPEAEIQILGRAEAWQRLTARANKAAELARNRSAVRALRAFKTAEAEALAAGLSGAVVSVPVAIAREARAAAQSRVYGFPGPFKVAGFTSESFRAIVTRAEAIERAEAQRVARERAEREAAELAARVPNWRAGGRAMGRLTDENGGALLRVSGESLQTSWGAEVPLSHAIRAFRFIALCRASGKAWNANGKTLPVGHFRVDSVSASGRIVAGCHVINWPEIEAAARAAGVSDLAPADTTEPASA